MQHHGDNPLANMRLTSNPELDPEMLNFGHGGASDVNVVDGDLYDDADVDAEDYEWKKGEFRDEEFSDEEFSSELEDDENFDDVGNKSFNDIEGEETLSLNENVKRDMTSMKYLIGYNKKTQ